MPMIFHPAVRPEPPGDVKEVFFNERDRFYVTKSSSRACGSKHMHDFMQLWYCYRGSFRHFYNGTCYIQKKGDFFFVPPFLAHRIDTSDSDDVEFIVCDLSMDFFKSFSDYDENDTLFNLAYLRPLLFRANSDSPFVSLSEDNARQMERLVLELLNEYQKPSELSVTYLRATLARLFTLVTDEYELNAPKAEELLFLKYRTAIQDALDFIDSHSTENIYVGDVSKIALMSVRSFTHIFKQITGKSFVEYLHVLRVRRARELLLTSDKSLNTICDECGFTDVFYFSRVFKKIIGVSPSIYRKDKHLQEHVRKFSSTPS